VKKSKPERRRKAAPAHVRALKWIAALGVVALVVYGVSQMGGVPYGERELSVVNFSDLTPSGKRSALKAANLARCTCGCGLGLAECVATDSTCPVREGNIDRIKTMVREAGQL
jgi:hypothetical protein